VSTVPILTNAPLPFNSRELKAIRAQCTARILDVQTQERLITDLLAKANSPHDIEDHLWNIFRIRRKYHAIRKIVMKAANKARRINHFFDLVACQNLMLVEIDETFKGRHISLLVVVDALTGYIFMIVWLPQRSEKAIINAMAPLKDLFQGVQLVLTDGASYFPEVVKVICPNAQHQRCLIHILRNLYPFIIPQRQAYISALQKVRKTKAVVQAHKEAHGLREKDLDALRHKLKYWKEKRAETQARLGVRPYQKHIFHQYPLLKSIYDRINWIQGQVRSMEKTFSHDRERLELLKGDVKQAVHFKNIAWNGYMQSLHILYGFYNLFRRTPAVFDAERERYLTRLVNRPATDLSKAIMRVLTEVKGLSSVYAKNCPLKLTRNFINTNLIESVNSRLRPSLDKLKKIQNTPYLAAVLEIIRLRLNASRPYSKGRSILSPIERCGYKLRSKTWIDLIFEGLPPGPQSVQNLGALNLEQSYPGRFHHEKENISIEKGVNL
jgi:transposase-like protein